MLYIMPRNEAKEFISAQADRYYAGEISRQEYMAIEIQYTPLDLSFYPTIKPETRRWINILFDEETTDRKGNYMLRGFTRMSAEETARLNCIYGDAGCDCLNFFAYNDEELLIYTYCEGDTTLTILPTREAYETEKAETARWYREER